MEEEMMNVASLENCKRLYELSGWTHFPDVNDLFYVVRNDNELDSYVATWHELKELPDIYWYASYKIPAYDSGYLLRKLHQDDMYITIENHGVAKQRSYWTASEVAGHEIDTKADTPEDALCLLAIKLFEEGILQATESQQSTKGSKRTTDRKEQDV